MKSFKYSLIVTIVGIVLAGLFTLMTSLWLDARKERNQLSHEKAVMITEVELWKDELGKEHSRTYQYSIEKQTLLNSKDSAIRQNKILQNIASYYKNLPRKEQKNAGVFVGVAMRTENMIKTETPEKLKNMMKADEPFSIAINDQYLNGVATIYKDSTIIDYNYQDSLTGSMCNKSKSKWNWKHPFKKRPTYYKADFQLSNPKSHITNQQVIEIKK